MRNSATSGILVVRVAGAVLAIGALLLAVGQAGAQTSAGFPRAAGGGCTDVILIGARGSGQSAQDNGGFGAEVGYAADVIESYVTDYRVTVRRVAINYPARSVDTILKELDPAKFLRGMQVGVDRTIATVKQLSAACPDSALMLVGYSQGAMVIHQAENELVFSDELGHIAGTLLIADGDRDTPWAVDEFGSAVGGQGIEAYFDPEVALAPPLPDRTVSVCTAGDVVCDFKPKLLKRKNRKALQRAISIHQLYLEGVASVDLHDAARALADSLPYPDSWGSYHRAVIEWPGYLGSTGSVGDNIDLVVWDRQGRVARRSYDTTSGNAIPSSHLSSGSPSWEGSPFWESFTDLKSLSTRTFTFGICYVRGRAPITVSWRLIGTYNAGTEGETKLSRPGAFAVLGSTGPDPAFQPRSGWCVPRS